MVDELFKALTSVETDMTIFFRRLENVEASSGSLDDRGLLEPLGDAFYVAEQLTDEAIQPLVSWLRKYTSRLERNSLSREERLRLMRGVNPKYVLRNYLAQMAIDKAEAGDVSLIGELLEVLRHPYDDQPNMSSTPPVAPTGPATAPAAPCFPVARRSASPPRPCLTKKLRTKIFAVWPRSDQPPFALAVDFSYLPRSG